MATNVAGGRRGFTKEKHYATAGYPAYSAGGQDGFVADWEFDRAAVVVPSIGSIGRAYRAEGRWTTLANTQVIFPSTPLDHRFLHHRVDDTAFWPVSGTAQPFIKPSDIGRCRLLLPPLPEQRRIAEILDTIDEAIRRTEEIIAKLKQVKQGLLHDLLTRGIDDNGELRDPDRHPDQFKDSPLGRIPKAWGEALRLDELEASNEVSLGRGRVISMLDVASFPGPYPIYSSSSSGDGVFARYGQFMFDEELITWSVDGGGRPFHRSRHRFSVTNVGGYLRVLATARWDYRFLHALMLDQHSRLRFDWQLKAHPSVIRELYWFPCPSLSEQRLIASMLDSLQARVEREDGMASKLRELRRGLADNLLTGRVRVTGLLEEAAG